MKFLHSADWQLGARFAQFAEQASRLREIRVETLARTLQLASDRGAEAFLIAGDLFEDNQVESSLVQQVVSLFNSYPDLPILILPGNHDPYSGPDSVWDRPVFLDAAEHVTVIRQQAVMEIAGVSFLAAPLLQKVSTLDPSLALRGLADSLPGEVPRVGMTHGAIAIPGKHQANDFPIALDAASRANLDYLAVGHWHRWQVYDEGRLVMPGTPEPDSFGGSGSGRVAWVELTKRGHPPVVTPVEVGALNWIELNYSFSDAVAAREQLSEVASDQSISSEQKLVRVVLEGEATSEASIAAREWISELLCDVFALQIVDRSQACMSAAELEALSREHPLVGLVLEDLAQVGSAVSGGGVTVEPSKRLAFEELTGLLEEARIPLEQLSSEQLDLAREVLIKRLREVSV